MNTETSLPTTRAFISYSWSSPTHEAWVINLASRLRADGVDVILDKWDLKPGHDSYQFMESMVTDATVTKVMMVCDKAYVEKANSRTGGVGTESQIISPELYGKGTQDKYAALMTEADEDGSPYVPVFYKGRIFFDFRSGEKFEEGYEQLLRWLINRPLHVKPKLGTVPESILNITPVATATETRAKRAENAIREGANSAAGLIREYGEALVAELKELAPQLSDEEPFDETIVHAIGSMRPYLRQFSQLISTVMRFGEDHRVWERVLSLHEQLGALMYRSPEVTSWNSLQYDAYKVFAHDAFLVTVALGLEEERFDLVAEALARPYLVRDHDGANRPSTSDFTVFRQYVRSLDMRNERLKLNRISLDADLLKEAFLSGAVPNFEALMQADFVLYVRAVRQQQTSSNWYPHSLVYAANRFSPFPVFARSESKKYFESLAPVLNAATLEEFKNWVAEFARSERSSRIFDYHGLPVSRLANSEHLGTLS